MPEEEKKENPRGRKFRTLQDWESGVDKTLREAMERGEFDNLKGAGKPIEFDENPFTPPDWQLAYKMLKDAGYAPDWIELDKDIRKMVTELDVMLARHTRWERAEHARIQKLAPEKQQAEFDYLRGARARLIAQYRERAGEVNKTIDLFNLKAPSAQVHIPRIRIEETIMKFENGLDK